VWQVLTQSPPTAGPSPGFSSRGAKFLKYSIECMQQPGGQTWNGGTGTTAPPAGDGPDLLSTIGYFT